MLDDLRKSSLPAPRLITLGTVTANAVEFGGKVPFLPRPIWAISAAANRAAGVSAVAVEQGHRRSRLKKPVGDEREIYRAALTQRKNSATTFNDCAAASSCGKWPMPLNAASFTSRMAFM